MPKGLAFPKGRGPYAAQACTICRSKKSKCDGVKPVCGSCVASGRDEECSWGRDTAPRKPRTEAHFEALRKRADSLQAYVDRLEGILAKCVCQDVSPHLQFRPDQFGEQSEKEGGDSDTEVLNEDEEITQELSLPTQVLKLDDRLGGLVLHGITAPFRFGNRPPNEVYQVPEVLANPTATYVLQLDGVDISQSHPNIDWSRHLTHEVPLDRKQHDKILDLGFKFFMVFAFRLVPHLFLRDMYRALSVPRSERPPRTPNYSPMLHNAVLSLCTIFSDDPYLRDAQTRRRFIDAAIKCLEVECKKPDISLVQSLACIGSFYTDLDDRIKGELYFGMSSRIGMTLGLGVDATPWVKAGLITEDEMIARNWASWAMFSLDVFWALYFGRDFGGPSMDRRVTPMPHVDTELDQLPWHYAPANIPPQPNYYSLVFSESSKLFAIARQIIQIVHGLGQGTANRSLSPQPDAIKGDEDITKIDLELNNWKSQLPSQLDITLANRAKSTPQRLMLHLSYWWCFIVLHRPFFNRRTQPIQHSDREVDHVKLCTRAAENILELLETCAGTVFLLRALHATASPRIAHGGLKTALMQVETCIRYLRIVGQTWRAGTRTADVLQTVLNDRLMPVIARRLAQKGEQIPAVGPRRRLRRPGRAMCCLGLRRPPLVSPAWNPQLDQTWAQAPVPSQSSYPMSDNNLLIENVFPELDMSAFLPNFGYFGAPELWDQGLSNVPSNLSNDRSTSVLSSGILPMQ
ncbi:hypothetical protein B0H13DRAFT_2094598 [Mycena leptocephala]|nr:hypothetical protein B0H13DRAFT_2094598 [Mycena leptocephala]